MMSRVIHMANHLKYVFIHLCTFYILRIEENSPSSLPPKLGLMSP